MYYPKEIEFKARQAFQKIKYAYDQDTTLGNHKFKINIVLQNQKVIANGFVSIGPWQSEFFLTPPHDPYVLGPIDWTDALSIHEYRHVIQGMNSRIGINNLLYHILGEEAWGASQGLVIPDWFAEGDAVHSETIHTNAGRGVLPSFLSEFRALQRDQIQWPYIKIRNRSLKDLTPNHYVYGYWMTNYLYEKFGSNAWKKTYHDAIRYKPLFFSFKNALKKNTGFTPATLYEKSIQELKAMQDEKIQDSILLKNNSASTIKNFISPKRLPDGSLIYLEDSYNVLPSIKIAYRNGTKKTQVIQGITVENDYTLSYPYLAWTETGTDARWANTTYSNIFLHNLQTHETKKISHNQKYFRPALSQFRTKIVCMEYLPNGQSSIKILDFLGHVLQSIPFGDTQLPTFPVFEKGDTTLLSILRGNGLSQIIRINLNTGERNPITKKQNCIISNLSVIHDTIYFSSDINGRDNIYARIEKSGSVYQLTDNSIGIRQFTISGQELLYSIQSSRGIEIRTRPLHDEWSRVVNYFDKDLPIYQNEYESQPLSTVTPKPAGLVNNPFRIFSWSWRPDQGGTSFQILGQNVLRSIQGDLGYQYQQEDRSHNINGSVSWGTLFPVLTMGISHTFDRKISKPGNLAVDSIRWNETGLLAGTYIPFKFYHRRFFMNLTPSIYYGMYTPDYTLSERKNYQSTGFIRTGVSFSNYQITALQHVTHRVGQSISLQYNHGLNRKASSFDLNTNLYFPGFSKNHVIELGFDFHRQPLSESYRYASRSRFIHGYESFSSDRSSWWRAAYHLPWIYPDVGINGIFFLQRIRTKVFYENMDALVRGTNRNLNVKYRSIGTELIFDGKLLNVAPVGMGIRISKPLDIDLITKTKSPAFQFFIDQLFN